MLLAGRSDVLSSVPPQALCALIIDDSPDDAELVVLALRRGGFAVESLRVETIGALVNALRGPTRWDVIICDLFVPQLHTGRVIALVDRLAPGVSLIAVSGRRANDMPEPPLRGRADAFLDKDHLGDLPALVRALRGPLRTGPRGDEPASS